MAIDGSDVVLAVGMTLFFPGIFGLMFIFIAIARICIMYGPVRRKVRPNARLHHRWSVQ